VGEILDELDPVGIAVRLRDGRADEDRVVRVDGVDLSSAGAAREKSEDACAGTDVEYD
jgi:hypothetical protein